MAAKNNASSILNEKDEEDEQASIKTLVNVPISNISFFEDYVAQDENELTHLSNMNNSQDQIG